MEGLKEREREREGEERVRKEEDGRRGGGDGREQQKTIEDNYIVNDVKRDGIPKED